MKIIIVPTKVNYCNIEQIADEDLFDWDNYKKYKDYEGIEWFVYYYTQYSYEGIGYTIFKENGKYILENLYHCSCYNPLDCVFNDYWSKPDIIERNLCNPSIAYDTIDDLYNSCSDDLKKEIQTLVDYIKENKL